MVTTSYVTAHQVMNPDDKASIHKTAIKQASKKSKLFGSMQRGVEEAPLRREGLGSPHAGNPVAADAS